MPYDLTSAKERRRLLRETTGYAYVSLKDGTDHEGRALAYDALRDVIKAGYVLTPPVDQKTRDDVAGCLSSILSDIGGWLEDPDHLKNVDELIAIARRNTPQLTSNPCALPDESYQSRVKAWLVAAFGEATATDPRYRTFRFLEEAIELAQATGCTADEARQLVAYVFSRPVGEPSQEVGGVMVSLSGLCSAFDINAVDVGETELARCWSAIEKIRAKQAAKEASGDNGPLPGYATLPEDAAAAKEALGG